MPPWSFQGENRDRRVTSAHIHYFKYSQSIRFNMTFHIKDKAGQKEDEEMWEKSSWIPQELEGGFLSGPLGLCCPVSHGQ